MVSMSPCAFSIHDKIGELSSYVVNEKKWLGAELLNVLDFSTEEYERFVKLAILMGAKKDDSELTMEEIYENINNIPVENHNEMYKEYKDRLKVFRKTIQYRHCTYGALKMGNYYATKFRHQSATIGTTHLQKQFYQIFHCLILASAKERF